jgi:hypothetical protein
VDSFLFSLFAQPSPAIVYVMERIKTDEEAYIDDFSKKLIQIARNSPQTYRIEPSSKQKLTTYLKSIYKMLLTVYDAYQGGQTDGIEPLRKSSIYYDPLGQFAIKPPRPTYPFRNTNQQDVNELMTLVFNHFNDNDTPKVLETKKIIYTKTQAMLGLRNSRRDAHTSTTITPLEHIIVKFNELREGEEVMFQPEQEQTSKRMTLDDKGRRNFEYWNPVGDNPKLDGTQEMKEMLFKAYFNNYFDSMQETIKYEVSQAQTLLILRLERNIKVKHRSGGETEKKMKNHFVIEEALFGLHLKKIIVHQGGASGGHYVAYFECNNNWYEYNDIQGISYYGGFEAVSQDTKTTTDNSVSRNCTTLFYERRGRL